MKSIAAKQYSKNSNLYK